MRLLNTKTFKLDEFFGDNIPEYAILSHTWEGKEVSFQLSILPSPSPGWAKIRNSCLQARSDGYNYIWVDTCCIDKSSSAELQEAINSMFQLVP
ncbi:hypothetical protein B0H67DRAFT_568080 [Lasiosphaeris hirsuta]|uniref:Heterokaryon incompatibility domain-containing protein n=1 Tax=Lasiosphaeris hirsuta TaxID=260670 RepID=A0AA40AYW5_9PEZI|nr:hypothetical protein B0H67DRAFT_568080 [Lasiosphaeris hirsuta]